MCAATVFKNFLGTWILQRTIVSFTSTELAKLSGRGHFEIHQNNPNHLHYHEDGQLVLGSGSPFAVNKNFYYTYEDGNISVYFDGALKDYFHTLRFQNNFTASGYHFCSPDTYEFKYKFMSEKFEIVCTVTGKNKNYIITSNFKKSI